MIDYGAGKMVLAPMVRINSLPMRLLALEKGADLVWSAEIIDHKLMSCRRILNDKLGTVDFVAVSQHRHQPPQSSSRHRHQQPQSSSPHGQTRLTDIRSVNADGLAKESQGLLDLDEDGEVVFRTVPGLERHRLVLQLGSARPETALAAAQLVADDVGGIDLNCGCPKHFSIQGGMGAALLTDPDRLVSILNALMAPGALPSHVGVTAKIRLLPDDDDTLALVRRIVATGVKALTVHCRLAVDRPRDPVRRHLLEAIVRVAAPTPVIINGDLWSVSQAQELLASTGAASAMFARSAQWDPSVFSRRPHTSEFSASLGGFSDASMNSADGFTESCDASVAKVDLHRDWRILDASLAAGYKLRVSDTEFREYVTHNDPDAAEIIRRHLITLTQRYLQLARQYDNHYSNTKYTLLQLWLTRPRWPGAVSTALIKSERALQQKLQQARDYDQMFEIFFGDLHSLESTS